MSPEVPLVTEYKIGDKDGELGYIRFYLAPKIEDEEEGGAGGAAEVADE